MDRRNQILFAVLAILLVGWAARSWLANRPPPPPYTIEAVKQEDANAIEVTFKGQTVKLARRDADRWDLVEPKQAPADPTAVDAVFTLFKDPIVADMRVASSPSQPELFGLVPDDTVRLVIKGGDKTLLDLEIGKTLTGGAAVYRPAGSPDLWRGKIGSRVRLEKKADDWRDKRIMDFKKEDVAALELTWERNRFSFTRTDTGPDDREGTWAVVEPAGLKLDPRQADSVARGLGALRANELVDDPKEAEGAFDPPRLTVKARLEDGSEHSVTFGAKKEDKKVWIRRDQDGAVFVVTEATMSRYQKTPADLRDKTILTFKRDDVVRAAYDDGTTRIVAEPDGDSWKAVEPPGYPFEGKELTFTLNTLGNLRAAELVEGKTPAQAGTRGKGAVTVTVSLKDGSERVLRLGPLTGEGKDKQLLATVDGDSQVYALKEFTLNSVKRGFGKADKASPPGQQIRLGGGGPGSIQLPPNLAGMAGAR